MASQASQASPNTMQKLLTVQEAANYLGVSKSTIYRYAERNELPHIKKKFGLRFSRKSVEKWVDQDKRESSLAERFLNKALTNLTPLVIDKAKGGSKNLAKSKGNRQNYGFGAIYVRRTKKGFPRFYIDYYDRNRKRTQELVKNATNWDEALQALKNAVLKELSGENGVKENRRNTKFKDFAEEYLKKYCMKRKKAWERSDKVYLHANLVPFFGEYEISKMDALLIEDFIAKRLDDGVKKSSINRDLSCLRKILNKAVDWRYLTASPFRGIKLFSEQQYKRDRVLTNDEENRLYQAAAPHLRSILICALMTAMRKSEILTLKWENVRLVDRQIIIKAEMTKSGKKRIIPINDTLLEELLRLRRLNNGASNYVFLYKDTKTRKLRPVKSVQKAFVMACRRANIENFIFHDLRRTAASRMVSRGVDPISIKRILGHASLKTSEIYLHSSFEQMKEAVKLLDKKLEAKARKEDEPLHIRDMKEQSNLIH